MPRPSAGIQVWVRVVPGSRSATRSGSRHCGSWAPRSAISCCGSSPSRGHHAGTTRPVPRDQLRRRHPDRTPQQGARHGSNLLLPLRLLCESLRGGSEEELPVATGRSQAKGRQSEQRSTTSVGLEEVTMGTVLALSSPELPVRTLGSTGTVLAQCQSTAAVSETAWLTATIRPAGTFGHNDTSRLRALLDALSACASIVVLDLQVA